MTSKYCREILDNNITLHKIYYRTADEIGTKQFWNNELQGHFSRFPHKNYWSGLDVWIIDMRCPELVVGVSSNEVNLLDYEPSKQGLQTAAGLYFNKDRLDIGVFPSYFDTQKPEQGVMGPRSVEDASKVLCHELGHFLADQIQLNNNTSRISQQLTAAFLKYRPNQTESVGEDFAECYHAIFGNRLCFGTFSDGKMAVLKAELCTLFHTAYWLKINLDNYPFINLSFDANYVYWQKEEYVFQKTFLFFGNWVKSVTGFYRLNRNCVLETHKNGQWIKV